ncbi:unnamed protein product [Cuscuta campestris]|uniref:Receptor-like serine/threonine-protein kinase n=1 Tax=Cuscuta campestris TaxID=132261 RepID=A0A484K4R4_9ASTE|nr:unnamed protein product [Cuscuta campestris]
MACSYHRGLFMFIITLALVFFATERCTSSSSSVSGDRRDGGIRLGSRLTAATAAAWVSHNGTFAFGFTPAAVAAASGSSSATRQFYLSIWFAMLPGDPTLVWSPNKNSPVSKDAVLELDPTGSLALTDRGTTVWTSNTSHAGVESASMSETGNLVLLTSNRTVAWQSFSYPSDTLLPGQPLTVSMELISSPSSSLSPSSGYYTLKMLQQPTSLSLALTYNVPKTLDYAPEFYSNFSYWSGPDISNVTGDVIAVLDEKGSFGIVYGSSSNGAVYVHKNDGDDDDGLSSATSRSLRPSENILRRLVLEMNGNLRSKTNASCRCLPGSNQEARTDDVQCFLNSSLTGKCDRNHENLTGGQFKMETMQQTSYYFSDRSVIANYSDNATLSKCGNACLSDCECIASVNGIREEKPYCWLLKSLEFGGFQDPSSTLFVKVESNGSFNSTTTRSKGSPNKSARDKALVLPIVLSMSLLIGLLCSLLYINIHRKRSLKRALESSMILSGAPINFSYRDLQSKTNNFSHLLGTGGFGSVFRGALGDGTLIAVKKLDKVLPHGEKEFITEVTTIGSMHHMNLVRLCGFCSEGTRRLLVYEFMKNGSLDKWIFPSFSNKDRLLDWETRFRVALETAQGIAYFHEQCRNRIIHCDIKPENILLDDSFCPKVSDFGLAKLMGREHSHVVTMVRGTRGYVAPEWISNRPITVKADVYSYGMLLLEIIGGRRNLDMKFDADDFFFPGWAYKEMTNGTPMKVVDRRLQGNVEEEELVRALKVAFWCIQDEVGSRPSMGEVVKMLDGSVGINSPPMPQTVLELIEEGLDQVYRAMKREEHNQLSSYTITSQPSYATCSYSIMSPR